MRTKTILLTLPIVTLIGCAGGGAPQAQRDPTPVELKTADFGAPPGDVEKIVREHMSGSLFDPFSAVFRVDRQPQRMWVFRNGSTLFGYGACVSVNAKNRYGGFVGFKPHFFLLHSDRVIYDGSVQQAGMAIPDHQFCVDGRDYRLRTEYVASNAGPPTGAASPIQAAVPRPTNFKIPLSASQAVPTNGSSAHGVAELAFDPVRKAISWKITVSGLAGEPVAAHIHGPATPGQNAGVIVNLAPNGMRLPLEGNATLSDAEIGDLYAGRYYLNLHTTAHRAGEVRGQIIP